jgi:aryl-alcohol dehydrogenase-like predicted oxidoreductase
MHALVSFHKAPFVTIAIKIFRFIREPTGGHIMNKRRLGNSGLEVAPLAFGGNVFGWTVDETASFELLDAFTSAGFNLIDTADVYSRWVPGNEGGESERIIGRWLEKSGKRDKVLIATKVGKEMGPNKKGLSKTYILRAVEASLKRLRTDYIDLYQSHEDDPDTPFEETFEAYDALIKSGKVRAIGASNFNAERLGAALRTGRETGGPTYISLQPLYNLYDREDFETGLASLCRREGLGVITYFSLAAGFLTGKYRSKTDTAGKPRSDMVQRCLDERGFRILGALDQVAGRYDSHPASVALAWLISRTEVTAPIASATSLGQLNVLIAGTRLELDPAALKLLDEASAY